MSQCPNCGTTVPTDYHGPLIHSYHTAAQITSLSPDYLRKEVAAGRLLSRKIGRRRTIHHDDLMDWYYSKCTVPTETERLRAAALPKPLARKLFQRGGWD